MTQNLEEKIKSFGLAERPESVRRISQIVAKQNAFITEVAMVIADDADLTARLLQAANPQAANPSEYTITTVRDGLRQSGINWILVVAMGDPLIRAVKDTFSVMLNIELEQMPVSLLPPLEGTYISCECAFDGQVAGLMHLRLSVALAQRLGGEFLGFGWQELTDTAALNDAMGELFNMITGNFKSNLCDAKLTCRLLTPSITRTRFVKYNLSAFRTIQPFGFKGPDFEFFLDLIVNPWGA